MIFNGQPSATDPKGPAYCRLLCTRPSLDRRIRQWPAHIAINPALPTYHSIRIPIRSSSTNCCTASITNNINDFVGVPVKVRDSVEGVGGGMLVTHRGTIKWSFDDDMGRSHTFLLPGSLLAPSSNECLLSLAQWSQCADDNTVDKKGTWSATYDDKVVLHWQSNTYQRSAPYHFHQTPQRCESCSTHFPNTHDALWASLRV